LNHIFHNCDYLQVLQLVFVGMEFATLFLTIATFSDLRLNILYLYRFNYLFCCKRQDHIYI